MTIGVSGQGCKMAKDLSELIFNIRVILKEPVEGFWTDEYLTVEINHAQTDLALRLPADRLPKLQVTKKHNVVTGQSEYSLKPVAGIEGAVFVGAGKDEMDTGGIFTGISDMDFRVEITTGGATSPNVFKWSEDGGITWTTGVNMTEEVQTLSNGVTVDFDGITGYTVGDRWGFWARVTSLEILKVVNIEMNGVGCFHVPIKDIKKAKDSSYYNATADSPFSWLWGEKVNVKPVPSENALNGIEIMNIREPVALVAGEDTPEITSPHHSLIEKKVAGEAFAIHGDTQGDGLLRSYEDTVNGIVAKYSGIDKIDEPLTPPPGGG